MNLTEAIDAPRVYDLLDQQHLQHCIEYDRKRTLDPFRNPIDLMLLLVCCSTAELQLQHALGFYGARQNYVLISSLTKTFSSKNRTDVGIPQYCCARSLSVIYTTIFPLQCNSLQ